MVAIEARADPVFIQDPLDGGTSFGAGLNGQISTRFSLSQDATITSLRWWGGPSSGSPQPTTFSIRFFNDTGSGIPEIVPISIQSALM